MDLDRGILARLDRSLLAALDEGERFQMVRVPVTAAKWSTWKRYCDTAGVAMGRAIAALIDRELVVVFGAADVEGAPVLAQRAEERLRDREVALARRERELDSTEERLRRWSEELRRREVDLGARERRADAWAKPVTAGPATPRGKMGRNDSCPCGSGLKSELCHGRVP
ncbi:MAG TPA: SEC-C metal-binding domain-containing protein [Acidimicrobiia bacterium]|jgi:hypothetical protein